MLKCANYENFKARNVVNQARRVFSGKARTRPSPKVENPGPARARLLRPDHIPTFSESHGRAGMPEWGGDRCQEGKCQILNAIIFENREIFVR